MSFNMSVPTINPLADGGMSHSLFTCANDKCIQGRCVVIRGVNACECMLGYMGDTCSETINEALSLSLTLCTLAILIAFITVIFLLAFIRQKQKAKRRKRQLKKLQEEMEHHLTCLNATCHRTEI